MLKTRISTAKALEDVMKLKKVTNLSTLKRQFEVKSSNSGRITYLVVICNTPSCTCPDFRKNGSKSLCKHILFVLIFVLRCCDQNMYKQHIGDDDLKQILMIKDVDKRFMANIAKNDISSQTITKAFQSHPLYNKEQICTLHIKKDRCAKCRGCKKVLTIDCLVIKVDGALTVPFGKSVAVPQLFYLCPVRECFKTTPNWCNIKTPTTIFADSNVPQNTIDEAVDKLEMVCLSNA